MATHDLFSKRDDDVANPDISGIGVLISFLASAYLVLAFTIFAYAKGLVEDELVNDVDRRMFRFKPHPSRWKEPFKKGILSVSDQQIVTGIAILVAGFAEINKIDSYHWKIIVYLGWMSSNCSVGTCKPILLCALSASRE
ncbi:hypothetical protein SLS58_009099 [Diplodia intermedia]|uniref:Uncharacterized protein n=1 Tax=Diplodia intermedia TaxID=856260 RepID=A0ABR3TEM8_9PEZI